MARKLRWGILGTGSISAALAKALPETQTGELYAIGSRTRTAARQWARRFPVAQAYGSYDALLADRKVDAVYIALPNHLHCEWVVKAARAGKHILCEKPLASNAAEVMVMLEACRAAGVFFMEAFMWRCHPGVDAWLTPIRAGTIGEVRLIEAQFAFNLRGNTTHTRMRNDLSGGGIMDVGCYCMSAARLVAGAARGQAVAEPLSVLGAGHVGATGVDEWATAAVAFPGGIAASLACGVQVNMHNQLRIYGSKGRMVVSSPWFHDGKATVWVDGDPTPIEIAATSPLNLYTHEAEMLGRCVRAGRTEAEAPAMTWADSIGQQKALDQWRQSLGVKFASEQDDALRRGTLAGGPLRFRANMSKDLKMPMGRIPGLDKPVSRVVMGSMCFNRDHQAFTTAMLDDFFERGGNAADSAFIYGPRCEQALGAWIEMRGVREDFVILAKGAHTAPRRPLRDPGCDPETFRHQLYESLDRLRTDYVDIYCLHRDNPTIPVGEFVDALDEQVRLGRIRVFGGSNWSLARFEEANAYARKHGRQGFQVLSNHFSLARWNEPMWQGCLSNADADSKAWFTRTATPLLAWSSQASGFFTGAFDRKTNPERDAWTRDVARVWFNPDNFKRLERAQALARDRGCTATQVALAYVLNQPFAPYALIGPRTIEETRTSLEALRIRLTPAELTHLEVTPR